MKISASFPRLSRIARPAASSMLLLAGMLALPLFQARADVDSDNDGIPNTLELQMGTDPLDRNSFLRIYSVQPASSLPVNDRVQVCWTSVPGRTYNLILASTLPLGGASGSVVATVTATGPTACAIVPMPGPGMSFNVRLAPDPAGDLLPPAVWDLQATRSQNTVRLTVKAQDLVAVQEVRFVIVSPLGMVTQLTASPVLGGPLYLRDVPLSSFPVGNSRLIAIARDRAGHHDAIEIPFRR